MSDRSSRCQALIIGIANYPRVSKLPRLVLTEARAMADLLRAQEYGGRPSTNIELLLDGQATIHDVRRGFQRLARTTGPDDKVVIFFSGHGSQVENGPDAGTYLVPFDYDPRRPRQTAIENDELTDLLSDVKAKELVILLSACHSASAKPEEMSVQVPEPALQYAPDAMMPSAPSGPLGSSASSPTPLHKGIVGLALSGGGLRSSTFELGLLKTLNERGILGQVDYVSTVAGGGYIRHWVMSQLQRDIRVPGARQGQPPATVASSSAPEPRRDLRFFLRGVGSVLDIFPPPVSYLPEELGSAALRQDWTSVGADLCAAIDRIDEERT